MKSTDRCRCACGLEIQLGPDDSGVVAKDQADVVARLVVELGSYRVDQVAAIAYVCCVDVGIRPGDASSAHIGVLSRAMAGVARRVVARRATEVARSIIIPVQCIEPDCLSELALTASQRL
jgi:hypothetical protein